MNRRHEEKREAQSAPAIPMESREKMRNTPPANIWQTLRRLLNCNKAQLADRLGVTARTLRTWESETEASGTAGTNGDRRAADLLQTILRIAHSDIHAQWSVRFNEIDTKGGRLK